MDPRHKIMLPFYISSALLLIGIFGFPLQPKIMGIAFVQYMIILIYTLRKTMFAKFTMNDMVENLNKHEKEYADKGQHYKSFFLTSIIPFFILGWITIFVMIYMLFFK